MSDMSGEPTTVYSDNIIRIHKGQNDMASQMPDSPRQALDAFLDAAGWSLQDLSQEQVRLIAGMMTERQNLIETVRTLNMALDRAQSIADHDPLIPVYNRRAFLRELTRHLSFCFRYETRACLLFLDLDQFKALNDQLGHSTGDLALRKFGEILIAHTRESDLIGRLGGDEFAVLLINADEEQARLKARQFREDVCKLSYGPENNPMSLDVSCGVVSWERGESSEHLIERADEAMYRDKRARHARRVAASPAE